MSTFDRDRGESEQREQRQHQRVGRQDRRVAADRVARPAGEHAGHRVRVHEQRERRAERERAVGPVGRLAGDERPGRQPGRLVRRRHLRLGRGEHVAEADVDADVDDRHRDHDVDQGVLDERDQRRRAQTGRVRVRGEHGERDDQRQVAHERVARTAQSHRVEHGLDADELQRDVGHRRDDAGDRDGEREAAAVVASADEVGRRDVAATLRDRPQARQEDEDDRVGDDRVRHGEEPGHRAGRVHRGRHRDERVGRVEVTAQQEPGDDRAEAAAAEPPLVQAVHRLGPPPAHGDEAAHRDDDEEEQDDAELDAVDARSRCEGAHRFSPRALVITTYAE